MDDQAYQPYQDLPHILFLFLQMATIGVLLVFFLVTFLTFDDALHAPLLILWNKVIATICLLSLATVVLYFIWIKFNPGDPRPSPIFWRGTMRWYMGLPVISGVLVISAPVSGRFSILNFILAVYSVMMLIRLAQHFSLLGPRRPWRHPTTAGGIVEGAAALGLITAIWYIPLPEIQEKLTWILLITLLLEILTLWGRFYFLNTSHPENRQAVKIMLGSHLLLFSVRLIFGLIMPVVYLLWTLLRSTPLPFHPVLIMILVGEMSERILFFVSSRPADLPPSEDSQPSP